MNALDPVFRIVLTASAQAAAIALVVVLLQLTLGRRLGVRWQYALWLVVLARLLMPWTPGSPVSVWNVAERLLAEAPEPPAPLPSLRARHVPPSPRRVDLPALPPAPLRARAACARYRRRRGSLARRPARPPLAGRGPLGPLGNRPPRRCLHPPHALRAPCNRTLASTALLADCCRRIGLRSAPPVFETPLSPSPSSSASCVRESSCPKVSPRDCPTENWPSSFSTNLPTSAVATSP